MIKLNNKNNYINIQYMNVNIITAFGVMDICKLYTLYGENVFRRFFHNFENCEYNPKKIPYIELLNNNLNLLNDDDIILIKSIYNNTEKNTCTNTVLPILSSIMGGNYSNKCTYYYNDFNDSDKLLLDDIGNKMIPYFEKLTNKKLILNNGNFKYMMLSYEGEDTNFAWHYDAEHPQCYRTLFLFDSYGNISPFSYIDINGEKKHVVMKNKDGLFFKGTTTYHGVENSDDKNQIRRIVGWQYIEDPIHSKINPSLGSELKKKSIKYIICLAIIYIIIFSVLINYLYKNIKQINVPANNIYILTIIVIIYSLYLSKYKSIFIALVKFYLLCFIACGFNIKISILLFNYIIISEKILDEYT